MKTRLLPVVLLGALTGVGACEDDFVIPDLNNPGLEELESNPTRAAVVDATQGLMIGSRTGWTGQTGLVAHLGILGRESYTFDNSDPRYVDEMVAGELDPGNNAFGGSGWAPRYANIRAGHVILNSLEDVTGFAPEEMEAIRGFTKTILGLDYLLLVLMRDTYGGVVDVNRSLDEPLGEFVSREGMYDHVETLLDEGLAHLNAAGAEFPFELTAGYAGFDDPASFREFNRALRARAAVYQGDYATALAALQESFVDASADLDLGVYHIYSTGTGDVSNGLFQAEAPTIVAHPSVLDDAQTKPGGALDDRVVAKTEPLDPPSTASGLSSDLRFTVYPALDSPIPIVRNEGLLLLRAEARWFTGDRAGAMEDLNLVRTESGGLEPLATPATDEAFIDALLYERRYSLLFEGGYRWLDMRRFDRLDELPLARPSDQVPSRFPVPRNECVARNAPVPCGFGS